jgi:CRISPR-associated protein Cmr6
MPAPLYKNVELPTMPREAHRGLWYDRFFNRYAADWTLDETAKKDWIDGVVRGKTGDQEQIAAAKTRLAALCAKLDGQIRVYAANWHFATGLGNPHPVENGFLWHPVLGTPYIAGSAVKGLVRAWVEAWMEFADENQRRHTLFRWFGSEDEDCRTRKELRAAGYRPPSGGTDIDTQAGAFIFFDALPTAPIMLKCDVMTPHMGKWYEQGGEITDLNSHPERIPADWHDPVPVYFLVADRPSFQFAVAPRTEAAKADLSQVLDALDNALQWLGAGAKTAVGYGLMTKKETASGSGIASGGGSEQWAGVKFQFNKGNQEITATAPDGRRAQARGKDALALKGLLADSAQRALEKGRLVGNVRVEHAGGKNWQIIGIETPQ